MEQIQYPPVNILRSPRHVLGGIDPPGTLAQQRLDALVVLDPAANAQLGRHAIVLFGNITEELGRKSDIVRNELLDAREEREVFGGERGGGARPFLARGEGGTGTFSQRGGGGGWIFGVARGCGVGDFFVLGGLLRQFHQCCFFGLQCRFGGGLGGIRLLGLFDSLDGLCLLGNFRGLDRHLPTTNLIHHPLRFFFLRIRHILQLPRHRMTRHPIKQHVRLGILHLVPRHPHNLGIVHLIPFLLGHVVHIRHVVTGVGVFARVDYHGEEAADCLLEDGALEFGGQVGLDVEDCRKTDVALDLGRAGGTHVIEFRIQIIGPSPPAAPPIRATPLSPTTSIPKALQV
mmetsp:Transcript_39104/g.64088  ORF Transcript_39104/g.64088 Transcript_39104/m.64088 type:complete len:345 (-) Transcript_39104:1575-2609(-)